VRKHGRLAQQWIEMSRMCARARREQKLNPYTDLAMTPVTDDETETLEMFTHNAGARDQVAHVRKVDALTHGKQAAVGRDEEVSCHPIVGWAKALARLQCK